jgi:group I intron endonuclease
MVGIYKITSPINKIYIGQTWNIERRLKEYKNESCVSQPKLYNSIKKYGWKEHKFEIVCELPIDISQDILDIYETMYWKQYIYCGFEMMNIREPGSRGKNSIETIERMKLSHTGKKMSENMKRKLSELRIGEKNPFYGKGHLRLGENNPFYGISGYKNPNSKPINQYDKQDNFISEYANAKEAAIKNKTHASNITAVCKGKLLSAGGYKWKYKV